jgi:hypothetical protein
VDCAAYRVVLCSGWWRVVACDAVEWMVCSRRYVVGECMSVCVPEATILHHNTQHHSLHSYTHSHTSTALTRRYGSTSKYTPHYTTQLHHMLVHTTPLTHSHTSTALTRRYGSTSKYTLGAAIFFFAVWYPCERCPPWGRSRLRIRSWGLRRECVVWVVSSVGSEWWCV